MLSRNSVRKESYRMNKLSSVLVAMSLGFFSGLGLVTGCETNRNLASQSASVNRPDPAETNQHLLNGKRFLDEGNYDMAIVAYGMALEDDPTLAQAHRGLAETYQAIGIDQLAQRNHQRAIKLNAASRQTLEQVVEIEQIPTVRSTLKVETIEKPIAVPINIEPIAAPVVEDLAKTSDSVPTVKRSPQPAATTELPAVQAETTIVEIESIPPIVKTQLTPEPEIDTETLPPSVAKSAGTIESSKPIKPVSSEIAVVQFEQTNPVQPEPGSDLNTITQLIETGDTRNALNQSIRLSNLEPDNLQANRLAAQLLLDSGGGNEAVPFIQRLINTDENDTQAWQLMALARYQAEDFPQAVFSFQQAQRLGTLKPEQELLYARSLLRVGQTDRALILLEQIHGRQASFDSAAMLGSTLLRDRQYDRALDYLQKAHNIRPRDTTILNKLGACHIAMYRRSADPVSRARALQAWRSSLEVDPRQTSIRQLLKVLDNDS